MKKYKEVEEEKQKKLHVLEKAAIEKRKNSIRMSRSILKSDHSKRSILLKEKQKLSSDVES